MQRTSNYFKSALFLFAFTLLMIVFLSGINISFLPFLALSSFLALYMFAARGFKVRLNTPLLFWCLFAAYLLLRTTQIENSVLSYEITFLMVLFAMLLCNRVTNLNRIYRGLFWMSLLELISVILFVFLRDRFPSLTKFIFTDVQDFYQKGELRGESGIAGTPTMITMSILIILLFLLYQSREGEAFPIRNPIAKVALLSLTLVILIGQGGKSNLALLPFTFIVVHLLDPSRKISAKLAEIVLLGIVTASLVYLFFEFRSYFSYLTVFRRLYKMTDLAMAGKDVDVNRMKLYALAWEKWKEQPFLGRGWYSFYLENVGILRENVRSHVHNLVLELLHDMGIIGLFLMMTAVLLTFFRNLRLMRMACKSGDKRYERKFSFFLAFHIFFFSDAMLHVSFYQRNIMILYFIFLMLFYSECRNYARFSFGRGIL